MGIPAITIDTHSLIWYIDKASNKKLSVKAMKAIEEAEIHSDIYIPIITLMEIVDLSEKGKIALSYNNLESAIRENEAYHIIPLDEEILAVAILYSGLEIHDRLIVATAIVKGTGLVCRDRQISAMGINVIW